MSTVDTDITDREGDCTRRGHPATGTVHAFRLLQSTDGIPTPRYMLIYVIFEAFVCHESENSES